MTEHFAAFSFVDRLTDFIDGTRARGYFWIPEETRVFPSCLAAEAVCRLAAWVAMSQVEFRVRPVAALATETRFLGAVLPGDVLELKVDIEDCDDDRVAYGGSAVVEGRQVVALEHCVGPLLAVEDVDAPHGPRAPRPPLRAERAPRAPVPGRAVAETCGPER